MDENAKEIHSLVKEKGQLEAVLIPAGGNDFHFLLDDCADLTDIIDEIEDVSSQMSEKEHAAFEAKIKFSRKIRRKAKDLKNFEQHLVSEYENGHITLEHGKRMVSIIKLLRSKSVGKAKREAKEFYGFLENGARLGVINDLLLKKRAQVERAKRTVSEQLSGLEWLEKEPPIDNEKVKRHDEGAQLGEKLSKIWSNYAQTLKSMRVAELLRKMKGEGLGKLGFPELPSKEAETLAAFLQQAGLEAKTAGQLYDMAGQSEQLLRHLELDLPLFRQEVVARRAFLFGIMSFSIDSRALDMSPAVRAYLSGHDESARKIVERLAELEKTMEQDMEEWERASRIKQKREELAGADRAALDKTLQELCALEDVLDGKAAPEEAGESEKGKGIICSLLKFLSGN
jgi:hypothetical protein